MKNNNKAMLEINGDQLYNEKKWADYIIGDVIKSHLFLTECPSNLYMFKRFSCRRVFKM